MHYIVYTDGGSRGNPGKAGCGVYIICPETGADERRYKALGIATNNVAEYTAALLGITRAIELGATSIELRADSQLVIEQLSGNYKIKNPTLLDIYRAIQHQITPWGGQITYTHIPRTHNKEADRLSNVAMDSL